MKVKYCMYWDWYECIYLILHTCSFNQMIIGPTVIIFSIMTKIMWTLVRGLTYSWILSNYI